MLLNIASGWYFMYQAGRFKGKSELLQSILEMDLKDDEDNKE